MQKQNQICRFILEQKTCPFKDNCRYLHPGQKTNKVFFQQVERRNSKNQNKSTIEQNNVEQSFSVHSTSQQQINSMVSDHMQFRTQKDWKNKLKAQAKKVTFQSISDLNIEQEPETSFMDLNEEPASKSMIELKRNSRQETQIYECIQQNNYENGQSNEKMIQSKNNKNKKPQKKIQEVDLKTENFKYKKQIEKQLQDEYESIESISQDLTLVVKKREVLLYEQLMVINRDKIDLNERFKVHPYKKIPETNNIVKIFHNQGNKQLYILILDIDEKSMKFKQIKEVWSHLTYYNTVNIDRTHIGFFTVFNKQDKYQIAPSLVRSYNDQILSFSITSTDKCLFINHPDKMISQEELSKICESIIEKKLKKDLEQKNNKIMTGKIQQSKRGKQKQGNDQNIQKKVLAQSFSSESDNNENDQNEIKSFLKIKNPPSDVFKFLSGDQRREEGNQIQKSISNNQTPNKISNNKKEQEIILKDKDNSNSNQIKSDSSSLQSNTNSPQINNNEPQFHSYLQKHNNNQVQVKSTSLQRNTLTFDDDEFFVESDNSLESQQKKNKDKNKNQIQGQFNAKEKPGMINKRTNQNNSLPKKSNQQTMIQKTKLNESNSHKKQSDDINNKKQVNNTYKSVQKEEKKKVTDKDILSNQDQNKNTHIKLTQIKESNISKENKKQDSLKIDDSYDKDIIMIEEIFPDSPVQKSNKEQQNNNQDSCKQPQIIEKKNQNTFKSITQSFQQLQELNRSCILANRLKLEQSKQNLDQNKLNSIQNQLILDFDRQQNDNTQQDVQNEKCNQQQVRDKQKQDQFQLKQYQNKLNLEVQAKQKQDQIKLIQEQNLQHQEVNKPFLVKTNKSNQIQCKYSDFQGKEKNQDINLEIQKYLQNEHRINQQSTQKNQQQELYKLNQQKFNLDKQFNKSFQDKSFQNSNRFEFKQNYCDNSDKHLAESNKYLQDSNKQVQQSNKLQSDKKQLEFYKYQQEYNKKRQEQSKQKKYDKNYVYPELFKQEQSENKLQSHKFSESKERHNQDSEKQNQEIQNLNQQFVKQPLSQISSYFCQNKQKQEMNKINYDQIKQLKDQYKQKLDQSQFFKDQSKYLQDSNLLNQTFRRQYYEQTKQQLDLNNSNSVKKYLVSDKYLQHQEPIEKRLEKSRQYKQILNQHQESSKQSEQFNSKNKCLSLKPEQIVQEESKKQESWQQDVEYKNNYEENSVQQQESSSQSQEQQQHVKKVNNIVIEGKKLKLVKYLQKEDEQPIKQNQEDEIISRLKQIQKKKKVSEKKSMTKEAETSSSNEEFQQNFQLNQDKFQNNFNTHMQIENNNHLEQQTASVSLDQKKLSNLNISVQNDASLYQFNQIHKQNFMNSIREKKQHQIQKLKLLHPQSKNNNQHIKHNQIDFKEFAIIIDDDDNTENKIQLQQMEQMNQQKQYKKPKPQLIKVHNNEKVKSQKISIDNATMNQELTENQQLIKQQEIQFPQIKQEHKSKIDKEIQNQNIEVKSNNENNNEMNQQKLKKKIIIKNRLRVQDMNKDYYEKMNQDKTKKILQVDSEQLKQDQIPHQQAYQDNTQTLDNNQDNINQNVSFTPQELQQIQMYFNSANQSPLNLNYIVQNPHFYNNYSAELEKQKLLQLIKSQQISQLLGNQ